MSSLKRNSEIWQWALFSFVIAGLTGFLYRIGFIFALPSGLEFENIRHAHSHLMFFGWASLLPLYLLKLDIMPGYHAAFGPKLMRNSLYAVIIFGLLSFPVFLIYGYSPIVIGSTSIPLSVILSGLLMIGWYGFMIGYLLVRYKQKDFVPNIWFEGSLLLLFISSLGAWSVGLVQMFHVGGPLISKALTHFFLATFTEGWIVLVVLGMITNALQLTEDDFVISPSVLVGLIALGAPLTFPYGISSSLISFDFSVAARLGGFLIAEGVLLFVYSVFKARKLKNSLWIWPLLFLVIKSLMQLTASIAPADLWLSDHGIRILYLHVALLGAYTMGVITYIQQDIEMSNSYYYLILVSVSLLIVSLVLLTHFWPDILTGNWIYYVLAFCSLLPTLAVSSFWFRFQKLVVHKE